MAACVAVLALATGCRGQVVSVQNDSSQPVNVSVARSWTGVLAVPAHGQGEVKARLRPGVVEVAVERGGTATALSCAYSEGEPRLFVRVLESGRAECGNSRVDSKLP
jgi:hypothetical protein